MKESTVTQYLNYIRGKTVAFGIWLYHWKLPHWHIKCVTILRAILVAMNFFRRNNIPNSLTMKRIIGTFKSSGSTRACNRECREFDSRVIDRFHSRSVLFKSNPFLAQKIPQYLMKKKCMPKVYLFNVHCGMEDRITFFLYLVLVYHNIAMWLNIVFTNSIWTPCQESVCAMTDNFFLATQSIEKIKVGNAFFNIRLYVGQTTLVGKNTSSYKNIVLL